ncbi:14814_t:CDS:2 [Dentiscutata erythropus]|uniref:14814_t:CDS:1 n=1 Tax=Dentiscutata erythropus TaxID=1348616 RepID=A0A9N8WK19_9GLOM|nr:14814_t:CDS:2 [Dentiscutata erythropus]
MDYSSSGVYMQNPQQHAQQTSLTNPTEFHIAQKQRRQAAAMDIIGNAGSSGTPNNSFNGNTINPNILNAAPNQYYMSHVKQESGSIDVQEVDFDQQASTIYSPNMSPSPVGSVGSPINRNFNNNGGFDEIMCHSYKPQSHIDACLQYGESPGNASLCSQSQEIEIHDQGDLSISAPNVNVFNQNIFRQQHPNNFAPQSLPVQLSGMGSDLTHYQQGTHALQYYDLETTSGSVGVRMFQQFMDSDESAENAQKHAILQEKRRRRRESHNAVERRRRDNINEKIQEISTLIPDIFIDSSNKPNKGVILRKAVEYIKHLQQIVGEQRAHNMVLENRVRDMKSGIPIENNSDMNTSSQSSGLVNDSPCM